MVHELRSQPFRSLYLAFQRANTYSARLPLWFLSQLPRSRRPRPSWSLQKSIAVPKLRLFSEFGPIAEKVGPMNHWPTHRAIPDTSGVKGVWLEHNPSFIVGDVKKWADGANVQPARIPGYWVDKDGHDTHPSAPSTPGEKVILFLHGGGFISESAHPHNLTATHPRSLLARCPPARRALSVEYRLTPIAPRPGEDAHPFPTALLDALAGYHHLVGTLGFRPEDIVLLGDSAGGNLALALARYIVENIAALATVPGTRLGPRPPQYDMVLLSPWSDLGTSHETPGSYTTDCTYDFLTDLRTGVFAAARRAYVGRLGMAGADANRYLSPASKFVDASFKDFPRTFIELGDAERFVDMCRTLRDRMVRDMGKENVEYYEAKDAIHDHLLFPFEEPQNTEALNAIGAWLAKER